MSTPADRDPVDRAPTRLGSRVAVVLVAFVVLCAALTSWPGLAVAAVGAVAFGAGAIRGSRRWTSIGALGLGVGLLVGGATGGGVGPLLLGMIGTVVAWDVGEHAISLGEQLGTESPTVRNEFVHIATSIGVGMGGGAVGFVVFRAATGGRPTAALAMLLFAVVVLLTALRLVEPSTPATE